MNQGDVTLNRLEMLASERQLQVAAQEVRIAELARRGADTEAAELVLFALRRNLHRALENLEAARASRRQEG